MASSVSDNQSSSELTEITQKMYEKNLELAERNKMLDLLRKIDHIILSKLSKVEQIADQVTNVIISDSALKSVFIYLFDFDDAVLIPLSLAFTKKKLPISDDLWRAIYSGRISVQNNQHPMIRAIQEKKQLEELKLTTLFPQLADDKLNEIQADFGIKRFSIHPFFVRQETTGVIVFGFGFEEVTIKYWHDFVTRLPEVISIALNNAYLYKKIEESNERLLELDKLKDEFVSLASHELRTPMAAIRSYLWMTMDQKAGGLTEKQKFYLDRAYSSVSRLIKLVNNMLNISRIESGRISLKIEKTDLLKLINEAVAEVKPKLEEKKIYLNVEQTQLPSVLADSDKIKEVVINLVGNALKFTPENGRIEIKYQLTQEEVVVSIIDNGHGIAKEDLPKLFQKFSLVRSSYVTNKDTSQGTGLGLYICKAILNMHQGRIWAESVGVGQGSTFSFSLKIFNQEDYAKLTKLNNSQGLEIIHASLE